MQINKKVVIIGSVILVFTGIASYVIYRLVKKGNTGGGGDNTNDTELSSAEKAVVYTPSSSETTSSPDKPKETSTDSVLKVGSKGQNVALLQTLLNYVYGTKMDIDGRYGNTTRTFVKDLLGYTCLVGDCVVEPKDFQQLKLDALKKAGSAAKLTAMLTSYAPYINACKVFTKSTPITV